MPPILRKWSHRPPPPPLTVATVLCALALLAGFAAHADGIVTGDLPRSAVLGFQVETTDDGALRVGEVEEASPAAGAGLRAGDLLRRIDGEGYDRPYVGQDLLRRLDGGQPVTLTVERDGASREVTFTPAARPLEDLEGLDTVYGVVETPDGARLRTLVTRPAGSEGPLPAVFFTQWVSCDSVELDLPGAWRDVMRGIAQRSGGAMIRVERSAGGDSEGPGCHELDLETEVAHYRHAFEALVASEHVDPDRVVIWGNSLGGLTAPLVARGHDVAGVIVGGAGALTYLERMLDFDRIAFENGDLDPRELHERMVRHTRFHHEYLLAGKSPDEIVEEHPDLAGVWEEMRGTGDGVHYGRPYAFHRQAAATDVLEAWIDVEAPVLVLYNEYDQVESARGHRLIADTLNRLRPGSARYVELPQTGHSYYAYPSRRDALSRSHRQEVPELAIGPMLDWLEEVAGFEPTE